MKQNLVGNVFSVVCLSALLVACGKQEQAVSARPAVQVARAEVLTGIASRSYTFISEPVRTTELAFRVGGPVDGFDVQPGQFFRQGQPVASIDPRDFVISRDRAEALYRQAEADWRRTSSLYEKHNVSAAVCDKARADYDRARADFDMAANELADTRLLAPFDGYVQQTYIERHQTVRPQQAVVTFIDLSQVKAEVYVPEDMAVALRAGVPDSLVRIRFDRLPGRVFTPSATYLTQSAAGNNLSFRLTALVDNTDRSLLGGMAGTLSVSLPSTSTSVSSLAIPQAAVCQDDRLGPYVWAVSDDGHVSRRAVTLGRLLAGSRVEVTAGLAAGQTIALTRLAFLSEGQTVQAEDPTATEGGRP